PAALSILNRRGIPSAPHWLVIIAVSWMAGGSMVGGDVDRGEGAPAMRMVTSIPIAGGSITVLKPDGYHVMLLQIRQPLSAGERFMCSIAFQKAGTIETEV